MAPIGDIQETRLRDLCWRLAAKPLMTDVEMASDATLRSDPYLTSQLGNGLLDGDQFSGMTLHNSWVEKLTIQFLEPILVTGVDLTEETADTWVRLIEGRAAPEILIELGDMAKSFALHQLWKDLTDETSPRHVEALGRLFVNTVEHLQRSSFRYDSSPTPAFNEVKQKAKRHGSSEADMYSAFWERRIWPNIIHGENPIDNPLHLHGKLQTRANSFITDFNDELNAKGKRIGSVSRTDEDGVDLDGIADIAQSQPGELPSDRVNTNHSIVEEEVLASDSKALETYILSILDSLTRMPKRKGHGLAFAVEILGATQEEPPEGSKGWGPTQKALVIVESWQRDPTSLENYLDRLNFSAETTFRVRAQIISAMRSVSDSFTDQRAHTYTNRFRSDLRQDWALHGAIDYRAARKVLEKAQSEGDGANE